MLNRNYPEGHGGLKKFCFYGGYMGTLWSYTFTFFNLPAVVYLPRVTPVDRKIRCHAFSLLFSNFSWLVEKVEPLQHQLAHFEKIH